MAGNRDNEGKPRLHYIFDFPRALEELAKVSQYGAEHSPRPDGTFGYGKKNWKGGLKLTESFDSMLRHYNSFFGDNEVYDRIAQGQGFDIMHLAQGVWNGLVILEMYLTRHDMDDREFAPSKLKPFQ